MGLPLSLPGVQESCAVLSVISSTATLSGGPGGPKSVRQPDGWTWGESDPFREASLHQSHKDFCSWLHIKAITLPVIKGYVLVCMQGLFIHCVCDAQGYEVITEHGNTSRGKTHGMESFMRKGKRGYMGAGHGGKNKRRANGERDASVCDYYELWPYHVAVVCATAQLFKCFAWYFADV